MGCHCCKVITGYRFYPDISMEQGSTEAPLYIKVEEKSKTQNDTQTQSVVISPLNNGIHVHRNELQKANEEQKETSKDRTKVTQDGFMSNEENALPDNKRTVVKPDTASNTLRQSFSDTNSDGICNSKDDQMKAPETKSTPNVLGNSSLYNNFGTTQNEVLQQQNNVHKECYTGISTESTSERNLQRESVNFVNVELHEQYNTQEKKTSLTGSLTVSIKDDRAQLQRDIPTNVSDIGSNEPILNPPAVNETYAPNNQLNTEVEPIYLELEPYRNMEKRDAQEEIVDEKVSDAPCMEEVNINVQCMDLMVNGIQETNVEEFEDADVVEALAVLEAATAGEDEE
ncbi:uncharacterized protein LOC102358520 [Latimeria chalumnae]|uniref:uncharacterized protein LOC102358520 n=1 Tax=Latimeria chalumnae TaxID=7897 RepID=UPI0006D91BCD|nr:PREDICTED: uncharacterized protein LOC102358520 [Latimeria chalumnae]|eukprot:XP_006004062.2 PREDICTED: uncharacterized protein LOC102358520 [Latimeria chalumnae]